MAFSCRFVLRRQLGVRVGEVGGEVLISALISTKSLRWIHSELGEGEKAELASSLRGN